MAAGLLSLDGVWGFKGWQWLFLVEGLPTVLLGMYIHRILVDGPAKATFLTPEERELVILRKAQNMQARPRDLTVCQESFLLGMHEGSCCYKLEPVLGTNHRCRVTASPPCLEILILEWHGLKGR